MSGKKLLGGLIIILLGVGLVALLTGVRQSTETRQHASSIFEDLNTAGEIGKTNNADGTMGPATWQGNFSNSLPDAYLGSLNFGVTDPEQGRMPAERIPTVTPTPTKTLPTQSQAEDKKPSVTPKETGGQGGPQAVSALVITIRKVEVHLARLGIPGSRNTIEPTRPEGRPDVSPTGHDNRDVDKWETLNIGAPKTVDLVVLSKTHALSSLGITKLANGRYTEIRLYISTASATLANGTKVDLTILGKANIVRVVREFVIDASQTTTLSMDFDAQNSVIKAGDTYILKPVVAKFGEQE